MTRKELYNPMNILLQVNRNKKKARQSKSKILLTVFFDYHCFVHNEFLRIGQSVYGDYCLNLLRRLREAIRKEGKELGVNNSWFLHQDIAPLHTAIVIQQYSIKNRGNVVPQAPFLPDMNDSV